MGHSWYLPQRVAVGEDMIHMKFSKWHLAQNEQSKVLVFVFVLPER